MLICLSVKLFVPLYVIRSCTSGSGHSSLNSAMDYNNSLVVRITNDVQMNISEAQPYYEDASL